MIKQLINVGRHPSWGEAFVSNIFEESKKLISSVRMEYDFKKLCKGRLQKKTRKKYGLLPKGGGGGVSEGRKKPNLYFGV